MSRVFQQSEATASLRWLAFQLNNVSDGQPATGQTFSGAELQIAKNDGAWANAANSGTVVERGVGVYLYPLAQAEIDTTGLVFMKVDKATFISYVIEAQVWAIDVFDVVKAGLQALPNAAATALGGILTRGTGVGQINQDANGRIDVRVTAFDETTLGIVSGAVVAGTLSTTQFTTNLTAAETNKYRRAFVRFRTGALAGETVRVTAYNGGTKMITVEEALTAAPVAGDVFEIVNGAR